MQLFCVSDFVCQRILISSVKILHVKTKWIGGVQSANCGILELLKTGTTINSMAQR